MNKRPHKSILTSLCALYAIALASWFGLAAATGDRLWWVAFLSDLALALMLPLPVLLLLALWRRHRAALAVLVIPILLGLWLFGAQFLPGRARAPQPGEHPIGAMTLNVLYTNRDFAALASVIRTANPDVVSLQEVGWGLGLTQLQSGWLPVQRIDYMWFAGNLVPLTAATRPAPGTDHRLVLAQFVRR